MHTRFLCILGLAVTCGGAAFAQGPAHAVTLMGTVTYQVPNSPAPATKSFPYNNAAILKAILGATGTSSGVTSVKDLDIAMNDTTHELDVVVKSSGALFFQLAYTGTDSVELGAIESQGKKTDLDTEIQSDYIVKVIVGPDDEYCACGLESHTTLTGSTVDAINGSFNGGTTSVEQVPGLISGSFKTSKKVYTVTVVN